MELANKNTVVTGAANGIGKAVAQEFHKQGARVVLADRDKNLLDQVVAELNAKRPNSALAVACDLSTEQANAELVARSKEFLGFIDLFYANAGVAMGTDLTTPETAWDISFAINVHAHRWAVKYLIDDWLAAGSGYFVSTASAAGLLTAIGSAPYSLTKHAALAFAEWLSITYGSRGLRVSCLCPQGVNTNMLRQSDQVTAADNGNVVRASGAVLEPEQVAGQVDQPESTTAAKNAELACPLGKLEVRGLRILKRWSPLVVGRSRLKNGLMPWLSNKLSTPISDDKINAWRTRLESATARIMPMMCHKMPKSPRAVAAVNNHTVGLKLRVGSSNLSMR